MTSEFYGFYLFEFKRWGFSWYGMFPNFHYCLRFNLIDFLKLNLLDSSVSYKDLAFHPIYITNLAFTAYIYIYMQQAFVSIFHIFIVLLQGCAVLMLLYIKKKTLTTCQNFSNHFSPYNKFVSIRLLQIFS